MFFQRVLSISAAAISVSAAPLLGAAPTGQASATVWSTAQPMIAARAAHTATLLHTGKVLVTGGYAAGSALATAELYDPATDTWAAAASMATQRSLVADRTSRSRSHGVELRWIKCDDRV